MIAGLLFWVVAFFLFYTYAGYPLLLMVLAKIRAQPTNTLGEGALPAVSVIIAARNEQNRIASRLENLLLQSYPLDLLEIIVVSDGSVDDTCGLVEEMAGRLAGKMKIILLRLPEPLGKPSALNLGVSRASGQILVFCDCRQWFAGETIAELVRCFGSDEVGCVSGELMFVESGSSTIEVEMGTYWRYEKMIRKLESASGSVVGVTGAVYAMRASLWRPVPPETLLDDLYCPLCCFQLGYRILFNRDALAYDIVSKDVKNEWRRKVRTLAGNWQLFSLLPELTDWSSLPKWWRFYSHKISRLMVIFLLPVLFAASFLATGFFYDIVFYLQCAGYLVLGAATYFPRSRKSKLIGLAYFFMVLNCAAAAGWWRWFRDDLTGCWTTGEKS